jgi:hypothetical protein
MTSIAEFPSLVITQREGPVKGGGSGKACFAALSVVEVYPIKQE